MKKLIPLFILGAAFGVVEGSVVVYLRPLLNEGMDFSIRVLQPGMLNEVQMTAVSTEVMREAATLVLLAAAAATAAGSFWYWACYFVFTFAVWDIFYYIWIAIRIGWPASLFDWDILFLIPVMWFAPVIVPLAISLAGIIIALTAVRALDLNGTVRPLPRHWVPVTAALVLWQVSFVNNSSPEMTGFPESYSWGLFWAGMALCLFSAVMIYRDFVLHANIRSS